MPIHTRYGYIKPLGFKQSYTVPMRDKRYGHPIAWKVFAKNYPDELILLSYEIFDRMKYPSPKKMKLLTTIHREIMILPYRADGKHKDKWEIKKGHAYRDCDDKTLELRHRLHIELNLPLLDLRPQLCFVNTFQGKVGHMVLAVVTQRGDFICDPTMMALPMIPYRMLAYKWLSRYRDEYHGWQRPTFYNKIAPEEI